MDILEYESQLIKKVVERIEASGGKECLSSIILTGSFGRGEPTYTVDASGQIHLKSDVEIALIYPDTAKKGKVDVLIDAVSKEFIEDLNLMAINEKRLRKAYNFNCSIVIPKYKTIFTYDLFNGSKTVWGHDFIGEKEMVLADVDPYEAKRLVANRIGELIYLLNTSDSSQKECLRKQWKGKLVLAIVSAWLICEGSYVSSYHGQYDRLKMKESSVTSLFGENFFCDYDKVFAFLRESGTEFVVTDDELRQYVHQINKYFKNLQIKSSKVNSVSRIAKYLVKYMKTGMDYGIVQFENKILQALIDEYSNQGNGLEKVADVWYRVLY